MEKTGVDTFTALLKREKDICVTFSPFTANNRPAVYRYQLDGNGDIYEVYNYSLSLYRICNINDTRAVNDAFALEMENAESMETTDDCMKKEFSGIFPTGKC